MKPPWGKDPSKWFIHKPSDYWFVTPPIGSFWGTPSVHVSGADAFEEFRYQTRRVRADD